MLHTREVGGLYDRSYTKGVGVVYENGWCCIPEMLVLYMRGFGYAYESLELHTSEIDVKY